MKEAKEHPLNQRHFPRDQIICSLFHNVFSAERQPLMAGPEMSFTVKPLDKGHLQDQLFCPL